MARYRRPRHVSDGRVAARRLLEARTRLIDLVFGPIGGPRRIADGALAVDISNAMETLEAAAENVGSIAAYGPLVPAPPVTAAELQEVRRCITERGEELAARRADAAAPADYTGSEQGLARPADNGFRSALGTLPLNCPDGGRGGDS